MLFGLHFPIHCPQSSSDFFLLLNRWQRNRNTIAFVLAQIRQRCEMSNPLHIAFLHSESVAEEIGIEALRTNESVQLLIHNQVILNDHRDAKLTDATHHNTASWDNPSVNFFNGLHRQSQALL